MAALESRERVHETVSIPKDLKVLLQAGDQVVLGYQSKDIENGGTVEATIGILRVTLSKILEFTVLNPRPIRTYDLSEAIKSSLAKIVDIRAAEDSMTGFLRFARIERCEQGYIMVSNTNGLTLRTTPTPTHQPVQTSGWVVPERRLEPGDLETPLASRTPCQIIAAAQAQASQK